MRVTQNMLNQTALWDLQLNMRRMAALQAQASTAKRLNNPEDDPYAVEQSLSFRARLKQSETIQDNVTNALDWLYATDDSLNNMVDLGNRSYDLALRGTTNSNGPTERRALAIEVNGILEQALVTANTRYGDRYIFSGFKTDTPAFAVTRGASAIVASDDVTGFATSSPVGGKTELPANDYQVEIRDAGGGLWQFRLVDSSGSAVQIASSADGSGALTSAWQNIPIGGGNFNTGRGLIIQFAAGPTYQAAPPAATASLSYGKEITAVTYQGDQGQIVREIAPSNDITVNLVGDPLFTDIINRLISLREQLRATNFDPDAVRATAEATRDQTNEILDQQSAIGTKVRGLETIKQRTQSEQTTLKSLISQAEDADMAEVVTMLTQQQFIYQSSLNATAQVLKMSLLDFLK